MFQKPFSQSSKYQADNRIKSYNILVNQIKLKHLFLYLNIYNIGKGSHSRLDHMAAYQNKHKGEEKKTTQEGGRGKKKKGGGRIGW